MNRSETWALRGLVVVAAAVGVVGLWALLGPEVDRGYACQPLVLGGEPEDEAAAARLDGSSPACESGDREITVIVSAIVVGAAAVALLAVRSAARRREAEGDLEPPSSIRRVHERT